MTGTRIEDLTSSNKRIQQRAIRQLYKYCVPALDRKMRKHRTIGIEAEDIFQDAITAVFYNIKMQRFKGMSSLETYTWSVCNNMWLNALRKQGKAIPTALTELDIEAKEEGMTVLKVHLLDEMMSKLSLDCQALLKAFYYEKKRMNTIVSELGISSVQVAKTKKFRCLKKLMDIVKQRKLDLDDFYDE